MSSKNKNRNRNGFKNNNNNKPRRNPDMPNRNTVYDSMGPVGRLRGTAYQLMDKYLAAAKDAHQVDLVLEENCLQHAEYYMRLNDLAIQAEQRYNQERAEEYARMQQEQNDENADGCDETCEEELGCDEQEPFDEQQENLVNENVQEFSEEAPAVEEEPNTEQFISQVKDLSVPVLAMNSSDKVQKSDTIIKKRRMKTLTRKRVLKTEEINEEENKED
ncbi:MAG: DUF4167 domain-containing protein [Alphaproteobacteria bacterium]|nr:DUF4167 domain-containing protein [Alphaproteobacteria bacterium]